MLFADKCNGVEQVVERYDAHKVGKADYDQYRDECLDEALTPADHIVRGKERTDDVARAVQQTEHIIDLSVKHKDSERKRSGNENDEILYDVCRNDVHTHRPQGDGKYKIADADIDVTSVEAYKQKP